MGLAESKGELILHIDSSNSATATFSDKFIMQGPFNNRHWGESITVPVTVLDDLIYKYGKPGFCKIDVEGFELDVLRGLNTSIPCISFEYNHGLLDDTELCLNHLEQFGEMRLNYAPTFDFTRLAIKKWTSNKQELLDKIRDSSIEYSGDIFVKFD